MQEDNNTCTTCGGAKVVRYMIDPVKHKVVPIPVSRPFKICTCPLPRPVHDGKLKPMGEPNGYDDYTAQVEIFDDHPPTSLICISGGYYVAEEDSTYLDPKQALSLLAWLKQNQAKLEELAGEEKEVK